MKLTIKKLAQIIREEVAHVVKDAMTEASNYGDYDPETGKRLPTDAQRRFGSEERNVGVAASDARAAAMNARRAPVEHAIANKDAISAAIEWFLTNVNDEGGAWQQEMGWLGGGEYRDWTIGGPGGKMVPRTKDMNDKIRDRIKNQRSMAKRIPFTVAHMAQDLNQSGQSAWNFDGEHGGYPSLSSIMHKELVPKVATMISDTGGNPSDAVATLKTYFKQLKR